MTAVYVGIDVGLTGAVAVVDEAGDLVEVHDTPTAKVGKRNEYLAADMGDLLDGVDAIGDIALAAVEHQQTMGPRDRSGPVGIFRLGYGFGLWKGILAGMRIPQTTVRPQKWKRAANIPSGAPKGASRVAAMERWPHRAAWFQRQRDDGRADAAFIAAYARSQAMEAKP